MREIMDWRTLGIALPRREITGVLFLAVFQSVVADDTDDLTLTERGILSALRRLNPM
jgi:hypothetical protein